MVYRHICKEAPRQFARFARELFGIGTEAAGEDGEKRAAEKEMCIRDRAMTETGACVKIP